MGKTIMAAIVSLDGFMADENDGVGPQGERVTHLLYDVSR